MASTPPPPVTEPDPSALTCAGDLVGTCAICRRRTHRYGRGGSPLCQWCMAPVRAAWGPAVRFTDTRA